MSYCKYLMTLIVFCFVLEYCNGWRAVPANQAMYAYRSRGAGKKKEVIPDELLPRTYLHSTYKFGYCPPEVVTRQFLRQEVNMSFESYWDSHTEYIYVITDLHSTMRPKLQCVVMKIFSPKKYYLYKSRIPFYYCQGQLFLMMFDTVQRLAIHEFYIQAKINMPLDFFFEFYHPNVL